jgi:hypothetical protein
LIHIHEIEGLNPAPGSGKQEILEKKLADNFVLQ